MWIKWFPINEIQISININALEDGFWFVIKDARQIGDAKLILFEEVLICVGKDHESAIWAEQGVL